MGLINFFKGFFREDDGEAAMTFTCKKCGSETYVFLLNNKTFTKVECHNCGYSDEMRLAGNEQIEVK